MTKPGRYLGGYVAAAFFAVGAPAALTIGYLCDKFNRRNLLFFVVLLGARAPESQTIAALTG